MTLETFDMIMKQIEEHGWAPALFLGLLFFWFIPWVKKMQAERDKPTIVEVADKDLEEMEQVIHLDAAIQVLLEEIRTELNSHWVDLWQFHNGVRSITGVPFLKMSVTHEAFSKDFDPRLGPYVNIPIGIFSDVLIDVQQHGIVPVNLQSRYTAIVNIYQREGVKYGLYTRVSNASGKMIGVVSVTFARMPTEHEMPDYEKLHSYAGRISMLLAQLSVVSPLRHRRWNDVKEE
jgi:hypothetical protein